MVDLVLEMWDVADAELIEPFLDRNEIPFQGLDPVGDAFEKARHLRTVVATARQTEFVRSNLARTEVVGHQRTIPRR